MKLNEFFEKLEKEFGLTPYDFCRIKPISYATLKKYLAGAPISLSMAQKIAALTGDRISIKEMRSENDG